MNKQHTTMKYIRNNWSKVFRVGYCDLQNIFRYEEPQYYNSGVYGWNCDVYCDLQEILQLPQDTATWQDIEFPMKFWKSMMQSQRKLSKINGMNPMRQQKPNWIKTEKISF